MKRLFSIILALALVFLFSIPVAIASDVPSIKYISVTNGTGSDAVSYVSTSTIIPGKHRILGYSVAPITSGTGSVVAGLYDAADSGDLADATLLGEIGGVNTAPYSKDFPGPVSLANGLGVWQGAYTSVTIYYERSTP